VPIRRKIPYFSNFRVGMFTFASRLLPYLIGAAGLVACGELNPDTAALTARSAAPAAGSDCAACHGYPLKDKNHDYHLFEAGGNIQLNGAITCVDCHSQSIRYTEATLYDTVYEDTTGEQWRTLDKPGPLDTTRGGTVIRTLALLMVDTLHRHIGVPSPARPGPAPAFQEYLTALAHMNQAVDVRFDSKNSNPARFNGDSASYNPSRETCSAVACHPGNKPYSFGSVAKGLPELKDLEEEEP
jgi:hypothetical protein